MNTAQPPSIPHTTAVQSIEEITPLKGIDRGVTLRVVVLSLLIAAAFAYIIPVADYKFSNTFLGATHFPPGAIAVLLLLMVVVNPILRKISTRLSFSRNETLTVYLTCLFSTLVPGIGGNNYFVSYVIGSFYYATRENRWMDFLKGLPPWFTPALNPDGTYNQYVAEAWYNGMVPGQSIPWGAWLVPLLAWGLFMFASFTLTGCLSVMLRAQWGRNEALAFPLLRLPLELTRDADENAPKGAERFFSNRLMWTGFAVAVFIQAINGLNVYFPDVPKIPLGLDTGPLFTERPWNQMGGVTLRLFPVAIGLTYLMTSEISFSCWFFFWFFKLQLILASTLGYPPASLGGVKGLDGNVFTAYQEVGAYLGYFGIILWSARAHLKHIGKRAIGRVPATEDERQEALSYPVACWGFILAFIVMTAWGTAAGMNPLLSITLWISYLVIAVVLSRVVAESGLLFVHHNWMPLGALGGLTGLGSNSFLSVSNGIVPAAFMEYAVIQDFRGSLMPSFVQAFKLAYDRRIAGRPLYLLIFAVILIGMVIGFMMNVRLGYENGGLSLQVWFAKAGPSLTGNNISALSTSTQTIDPNAWFWTGIGTAGTVALMLIRGQLAWFPLHPIGYIMAQCYAMRQLWFSIMIGWACKTLITRFGGNDTYRKTIPLFLGLALGDVAMMLFWLLIDGWQGRGGHQLMPG